MKIGLFSDTHDNLPNIEKAVKFFNRKKVDFVLHAGDFVAPFTIIKLIKLKCKWIGVFGNNDGEKVGLAKMSKGRIRQGPLRIKLNKKRITLVHSLNTIDPDKEKADLIVYGHTHCFEVIKKPAKLMVNPGEASGWLYGKATVAIVDLDSLKALIFKI
ncbi:MAG: metallophosphoesterase [Candidatus Omnitrophota bacterium]|nr:metallophosphoesterase [Candidatus Omnitrophota bacterium]MBU1929338.1 metallophosphoesterase [Candidatus Omnitrophota bacterium]MBU2035630.1 metallophosphoesterase [Candidatus Omnitrophota bacterium]MBU2257632.1 metallophosphoesterase [Candidatus Omnitrophota bacterium]